MTNKNALQKVILITGCAGLIGSEATRYFHSKGYRIVGVENGMRSVFFGAEASTEPTLVKLVKDLPNLDVRHIDIRDRGAIEGIFKEFGSRMAAVIHTAAQPSHCWAASDPHCDFSVNAVGTLNLLEGLRHHAPEVPFVFTSTNKVYGDRPNNLPLVELETRWEIDASHPFSAHGIDETMSIDQTTHSLFGTSKTAADLLVQEYGRYFDLPTVCFRGGCLTGPAHAGTELHGFLSYLMKCAVTETEYRIRGYKGKQVRDNIHSNDLIRAFEAFIERPSAGKVYNIGGGRHSHCSLLEAVDLCEQISGRNVRWQYTDDARVGDHIWWVSDISKFESDYPQWRQTYTLRQTLEEIYQAWIQRTRAVEANASVCA